MPKLLLPLLVLLLWATLAHSQTSLAAINSVTFNASLGVQDWDAVASVESVTVYADSLLGKCQCDLLPGECDPQCCCDPLCTDSLTDYCLPAGPLRRQIRWCSSDRNGVENVNVESSGEIQVSGFLERELCVYKSNVAQTGKVYTSIRAGSTIDNVADAAEAQAEAARLEAIMSEDIGNGVNQLSNLGGNGVNGALTLGKALPAALFNGVNLAAYSEKGEWWSLPTRGIQSAICTKRGSSPVPFGIHTSVSPYTSECTPTAVAKLSLSLSGSNLMTQEACEEVSAESVYGSNSLRLGKNRLSSLSSGISAYISPSLRSVYFYNQTTGEMEELGISEPIEATFDAGTSTCSNGIRSVYFEITYTATTNEIVSAEYDVVITTSSRARDFRNLQTSVAFISESSVAIPTSTPPYGSNTLPTSVSGNPGYSLSLSLSLLAGSVISGDSVNVSDREAIRQRKWGYLMHDMSSQDCTQSLHTGRISPLTFGNTFVSACKVTDENIASDASVLEGLCGGALIPEVLDVDEMQTHLGRYGNSSRLQLADWIPILTQATGDLEPMSWDATTQTCNNMVTSQHLRVYTVRLGEVTNPQWSVIGARVVWGQENVRFTQSLWHRIQVSFLDLTGDSSNTISVRTPPLLPHFPRDVFYPFNEWGESEEEVRVTET